MSTVLAGLLDEGVRFDAEYRDRLSNHRPMALAALARLGASDERLVQWARRYEAAKLHAAPAPAPWPSGDPWPARLGDVHAWPAFRGLFAEWLDQDSAGEVLTPVLPQLMQGAGCMAFHGLIRLAHAVQSARRAELADALAYWACRWWPVPIAETTGSTPPAVPAEDVEALLATLRPPAARHGLIALAMADAAAQPGFSESVARLAIDDHTLAHLARHSAALYARSGSFIVLHLVTSAFAMRVLLPFLADDEERLDALAAYWRAYACGHAAAVVELGAAPRALPWSEIIGRTIAQDDDHVIKLVDACREQEAAYGGAVWQQAATRAVTSPAT
jgi:hypothetical protein